MGLGPRPVPPHVFAVDEAGVRLCECRRHGVEDGRALEVTLYREVAFAEEVFPTDAPLGGSPRDSEALVAAVRQALADCPERPTEGSLLLPDRWLRLVFAEVSELPGRAAEREEILRWKLKQLVPFRVDDLRVGGVEVEPLADQDEPRRFLLGFGVDQLVGSLERAFEASGVHIGFVGSESQGLLALAAPSRVEGLHAVLLVRPRHYSVLLLQDGDLVLHRFKRRVEAIDAVAEARQVARELRLTRGFLTEHLAGAELASATVVTDGSEEAWMAACRDGLETEASALRSDELLVGGAPSAPWSEVAPMLGAGLREIA